ncbi:hypothetical protein HNP38_000346 [Chryseobacterium defluvii]|uniref:Secreted protein (Por secretion system target) n=1 Tax=Chryseobacterium defluvii TaxID=160396 RepID=A0A840KB82_9FLAO|nr:T9SS type A sorting domain-containing protein [Chryseobacterium defluvii]MBB4805074.1 hypothetical protein [Chryseobacterium defluvii]
MKLKLLLGTLLFSAATAQAQLATINENFDSFTTGTATAWPQNNWSKVQSGAGPWVYADGTTDKHVQYYSFMSSNTAAYLISPQIVAPDGTKTLTYKSSLTAGSAAGSTGTVQVGLVNGVTAGDMASFTPVGSINNLTSAETTYSITIPSSSQQYIAFRIIGSIQHTAIQIDDVTYAASSLAVSDNVKSSDRDIKFAVNTENTELLFVTKKEVKNIQVYAANGQKAAEGKLNNQRFDISQLQTGVYYMIVETLDGSVTKTKFIKR